jgi:ribonuclease P protein component
VLAATQRLRRSSDFAAAVRAGRRAGRGAVVVHLDLGQDAAPAARPETAPIEPALSGPAWIAGAEPASVPARVGFVVSKAVGGAVARNAVRRRLRHLVRERSATLPSGAALVVRALPGAAELPYARLGADLDAAIAAARSPRKPNRRPR